MFWKDSGDMDIYKGTKRLTMIFSQPIHKFKSILSSLQTAYNSWVLNWVVVIEIELDEYLLLIILVNYYIQKSKVKILSYRQYNNSPREMYDIKCSECGADAQVPFKPDGERPGYCRDCYQKQRRSRY